MIALLVGAVALVVVLVLAFGDSDDSDPTTAAGPLSAVISRQTPAEAPFEGLGELEIAVGGDRCLRVAVADSTDERVDGLRDRTDLGAYDGMLFVFQGPTESGFTMSGVTDPLEIAFYAADGSRTSGRVMAACPEKAETECPVYAADGPYEYAIETRVGQLPSGAVTACSST